MFLIREIAKHDLEDIYELSEMLKLASKVYFFNLPHDKDLLSERIDLSIKSFAGEFKNPLDGAYIFVLEDLKEKKLIGTSMIVAQHGTKDSPHQYFRVKKIEKFSKSLHIGFIHEVLEYGYDSDGPTEIGGLVLHPAYRNHKERLGKQLSFVRFLYIAMRRSFFKNKVLAELQPPLTSTGESPLWEAIGRKFTNLTYYEADNLSRQNKEFIISLFPEGMVYTCLLDTAAREAIGRVNKNTLPVEHMLKRIGFRYLDMIDPFDGGPHYGATTSDITLIQNTHEYRVNKAKSNLFNRIGLLGLYSDNSFRAVYSQLAIHEDKVSLPASTLNILNNPNKLFVIAY